MAKNNSLFTVNISDIDVLEKAMIAYQGNVEEAINDVLHNEGGELLHGSIYRLIPSSRAKQWKGKAPPASTSNSLKIIDNENLAVTVTTQKRYQYLYFPDDGTNTEKHIGYKGKPREFFRKGGELVQNDIVDRCIKRLIDDFN